MIFKKHNIKALDIKILEQEARKRSNDNKLST